MKCRKRVEIKNPRQITLKTNRSAIQGVCAVCGAKVFRIGKASYSLPEVNKRSPKV